MARLRRVAAPGTVQHVIARFVNREFRLRSAAARADYLVRFARALGGSDWTPVSFALMSSHVHLALVAGAGPASAWMKPLHTGVAAALNRDQRRLGPVFAERPRNVTIPADRTAYLLAYLHNNPVRAGLVRDPADSAWTAHRALIGEEPPPPWLDVARVLGACGFEATSAGQIAFHEFVRARSAESRDGAWSGDGAGEARAEVRRQVGRAAELGSPSRAGAGDRPRWEIFAPAGAAVVRRWPGDLALLRAVAARAAGVTPEALAGRDRTRSLVEGRRLVVLAGGMLGRGVGELADAADDGWHTRGIPG